MSFKAKYWLIIDTVIALLASVTGVAINFLIWEEGKSFVSIISFNLYNVLSLLVMATVASYVSTIIGIKLNYVVARFTRVLLILFVLANLDNISANIAVVGILFGITNAFTFNAKPMLDRLVVPAGDLVKFAATRVIVWSIASLSIPILVGWVLASSELNTVLVVLAMLIALFAVQVVFVKIDNNKQLFRLPSLMLLSIKDFEMRRISILFFGIGVSRAFTIGLLDVLIISQLGSIGGWTVVAVGITFLSIIAGSIIRKRSYRNDSFTRATLAFALMIYAISAIFILVEFNLLVFIVFTVTASIFEVITNTVLEGFIQNVESDNEAFEESRTSYQAHSEIFRAVGMLLPIGFLAVMPAGAMSPELLIVVLSVITLVPFVFSFALRTTPRNPFIYTITGAS